MTLVTTSSKMSSAWYFARACTPASSRTARRSAAACVNPARLPGKRSAVTASGFQGSQRRRFVAGDRDEFVERYALEDFAHALLRTEQHDLGLPHAEATGRRQEHPNAE